MQNYLKDLNKKQLAAVQQIEGASMVIAGAGSGKTRVLTYKIAHLLKNEIHAFNILALTFTNKAAKEMQNRVHEIIGGNQYTNIWMGTFHSVFSRILRSESEKINYPKNFTIYDTSDSRSLIKTIVKDLHLDKDTYKVNLIHNRISSLKNNFITPESYLNFPELSETDLRKKQTEFHRIYQTYKNRCYKFGAMDFDDLLLKTYELLCQFPETLNKYQKKFQFILVDEYQDTNHIQYLIIKKLAALNENICVVGDDAQSIYSFRGANIQNILNFKKDYPDYKLYKLEQNYRSTKNIVEAANALIKNNEHQIKKDVWTHNDEGELIVISEASTDNDEGRLVVNTIHELSSENQYDNFAVLYRTNAQSRTIEESLRKMSIPYKIYGGLSFYQRKEIKDLLAYFNFTINQKDDESLKRIINYPARGIGSTTIQKIIMISNEQNLSMWEAINKITNFNHLFNKGTIKKIEDFYIMMNNFIHSSKSSTAYETAELISKESGIVSLHKHDQSIEGISRSENIQELLNGIKDFCDNIENEENALIEYFMRDVALLTDSDNDNHEDKNKVTLMTIHASKGLEFPYVFVVGMEEELFPSMLSLSSQEDLEEERRLFYVAITRAEKRLFLSHSNIRFKWGQYIDTSASRFLSELNEKFITKKRFVKSNKNNLPKYRIKTSQNISNKKVSRNFKNIRKTDNSISNENINTFKTNQIVEHNKFGVGKIIEIQGSGANTKAIVLFENIGKKNLLLKFAKLRLIK